MQSIDRFSYAKRAGNIKFVIKGMLNKQIASELNIAEHTVKLHRGRITEKLGVKSVPEMIYIAERANIG